MTGGDYLLLSIRSNHWAAIASGRKRVELRRVRPVRAEPGMRVLVYSSGEDMSLVGGAVIGKVIEAPVAELWPSVRTRASVSSDEFTAYFRGSALGYAIVLKEVWTMVVPITLRDLRRRWPRFVPP